METVVCIVYTGKKIASNAGGAYSLRSRYGNRRYALANKFQAFFWVSKKNPYRDFKIPIGNFFLKSLQGNSLQGFFKFFLFAIAYIIEGGPKIPIGIFKILVHEVVQWSQNFHFGSKFDDFSFFAFFQLLQHRQVFKNGHF